MGWGNAIFKNIVKEGDVITSMECDINPDGDIKSTKLKMTWLANWNELVPVIMKDFDYMITKRKPEDTDEFEDIVNQKTEICTAAKGDGNLRAYNKGEVIQIERKGYFVVDRPYINGESDDFVEHSRRQEGVLGRSRQVNDRLFYFTFFIRFHHNF